MSTFTVLLLCIQACLVQNVFSSCAGYGAGINSGIGLGLASGSLGLSLAPAAPCASTLNANYGLLSSAAAINPAGLSIGAGNAGIAYGGAGEGNVAVAGELPVAGNTAVAGQVPILGVVNFGGAVPAAGAVSVSGQCACGCGY